MVILSAKRSRRHSCTPSCPQPRAVHAGEPEAPDEALVGLLIKHEVVRRVTQVPFAHGSLTGIAAAHGGGAAAHPCVSQSLHRTLAGTSCAPGLVHLPSHGVLPSGGQAPGQNCAFTSH